MKIFSNVFALFFILGTLSASADSDSSLPDMPDAAYRTLCHGIMDNLGRNAASLRAALEDCSKNLRSVLDVSAKAKNTIDEVLYATEKIIVHLKDKEINRDQLRECRVFEEFGISDVQGDEKEIYKKYVKKTLDQLLGLLNHQRESNYNFRISDFEEHYKEHDRYQQILVEIHREELLLCANDIKDIYALLGDEIDTLFDQFIKSRYLHLPQHKYVALYFKILKGYTTGKTDSLPEFSLCYLEDLDQNPYQNKCARLRQEMQSEAKNTAGNLRRRLELQNTVALILTFETHQRPILERHYQRALETLEQMNGLSPLEKDVLSTLRQKYPAGIAVAKKKKKKKKPAPSSSTSSSSSLPDAEGSEDDEAETGPATAAKAAAQDTSVTVVAKPATHVDINAASATTLDAADAAQIQAEMAAAEEQHQRDRETKKALSANQVLTTTQSPAQEAARTTEQIIHAQKAKLIYTFWHAETMPWDDFVKFMDSVGGPMKKPKGGGSHRKFEFIIGGSSSILPTYDPHKFGSSKVGSGQLGNARKFLRTILLISE